MPARPLNPGLRAVILLLCLSVIWPFPALAFGQKPQAPAEDGQISVGTPAGEEPSAGPAAAPASGSAASFEIAAPPPPEEEKEPARPDKEAVWNEGTVAPVTPKEKPPKYGIYIYRDGDYIRLPSAPVYYSGVWFSVSLSTMVLGASYVEKQDVKDLPEYREGDLLAIHYKGAARQEWYYYPLSYYPRTDFQGNNEAEIWARPEGYYLGFAAIGHPKPLNEVFNGGVYEDGYRVEQQRIRKKDIAYKDKNLLLARLVPVEGLPLSQHILTNKSISYTEPKDYQDVLSQLPEEGVLFDMAAPRKMDNFAGKRDYIRRFNEDIAVRHLVTQKEYILKKDKIEDTGIFVQDPCYVRFLSDGDFNLVLRPGEWVLKEGWMPADYPFGQEFTEIPFTRFQAHGIPFRHFALRMRPTTEGTQIRLQGLADGTRVTVVYSPIYAYDVAYHGLVEQGYTLYQEEKYAEAVAKYEEALKIQPEYPFALNNLAWLYLTAKDEEFFRPVQGLRHALHAGRFRPTKPYILDTISLGFFLNGHLDRAIEVEEMAYADSEAYSKHYQERMARYRDIRKNFEAARKAEEAGDIEEALKELHFAVEKMPNYVDALNRLAWIYATVDDEELRSPEIALEFAEQAFRIAPDRPIVLDTMAEAWHSAGDDEKALTYAKRALYFEPYDEYVQERVRHFEALQ